MDREAWRAAVHGVAKSRTRLSNWTELNSCIQSCPPTLKYIVPIRKPAKCISSGLKDLNYILLYSHSVVSNFVWLHGLQHARHPCSSLFPRVYSNSCPLSRWCHSTSSSSVIPFSSCPQSFQKQFCFCFFSNELATLGRKYDYIWYLKFKILDELFFEIPKRNQNKVHVLWKCCESVLMFKLKKLNHTTQNVKNAILIHNM